MVKNCDVLEDSVLPENLPSTRLPRNRQLPRNRLLPRNRQLPRNKQWEISGDCTTTPNSSCKELQRCCMIKYNTFEQYSVILLQKLKWRLREHE